MKEVVGIQYLRGLAALSVVVFHSLLYIHPFEGKTPYGVSLFAAGVDLFFVISGFIIWTSTQGRSLSPLTWWKSRFIRIAPLYWLALAASLCLIWLHGGQFPREAEILKAFAFVPSYDSRTGELAPFFVPGWTLNYEFFFYALMGLSLFIKRPALRLATLVVALGACVAMRKFVDPSNAVGFAYSSPLVFEFVGGIGVAIAYRRLADVSWKPALGLALLALAVVLLVAVSPRLYEHGPRAVYFGAPAVLIVMGLVCLEGAIRQHPMRLPKLMGDASYSLYLSHEFILYGVLSLGAAVGRASMPAQIAMALIACGLLGVAVHKTVEKPLLRTLRGRRRPVPAPAPSSVLQPE